MSDEQLGIGEEQLLSSGEELTAGIVRDESPLMNRLHRNVGMKAIASLVKEDRGAATPRIWRNEKGEASPDGCRGVSRQKRRISR